MQTHDKFPVGRCGIIDSLVGVTIGDLFMYLDGSWESRLRTATCTAVTPKQCTIGHYKYRLVDAMGLGGDSYRRPPRLMPVDKAKLEEDDRKHALREMRYKLGDVRWKDVPDELVRSIWKEIDALKRQSV